MSDKEITLKVGSKFDGKGTDDAKKALGGLGPAAQGAAGQSLQGFGKVKEGLASVSKGVKSLNQLVAGFGIIGALTKVASFASGIIQHFKDIETARRELQEGLDKIAKDRAEGFSGKVVSELADALKRANDELDRAAARQKAQANARRAGEDAAASLEEAEELAAISPDDPLAAQKSGEIRAKHAAARGNRAARRKVEDIQTDIAGMDSKRTQLLDASHADNQIADMHTREAEALRKQAVDERYEGEKLVMPAWWEMWKSPEADPKAQKEAHEKAAATEQKAEAKRQESAKATSDAESKRKDADLLLDLIEARATERSAAMRGVESAATIGRQGVLASTRATEERRLAIREENQKKEVAANTAETDKEIEERTRRTRDEAIGNYSEAKEEQRQAQKNYRDAIGKAGRQQPEPDNRLGSRSLRDTFGDDGRIRQQSDQLDDASKRLIATAAAALQSANARVDALEKQIGQIRAND